MLGNTLKSIRIMSGEKQTDMAKKIGVSQMTLSRIENGIAIMKDDTFRKIIDNYDLEDYLRERFTMEFASQSKEISEKNELFEIENKKN